MIRFPKAVLKRTSQPCIADLGDFYGIGSTIYNKDLTLAGADRPFNAMVGFTGTSVATVAPTTGSTGVNQIYNTGARSTPTTLTLYDGEAPFLLQGSHTHRSLNLYYWDNAGNSSYASLYQRTSNPKATPASYLSYMKDTHVPFFDSTSGTTQGKRFFVGLDSALYQVNADGTLTFKVQIRNAAGTLYGVYGAQMGIFLGENSTQMFVMVKHGHGGLLASSQGVSVNVHVEDFQYDIYAINKSTFVVTQISYTQTAYVTGGPNSGISAFTPFTLTQLPRNPAFKAPKIYGPTQDNKVVIVFYNTSTNATGASASSFGVLGTTSISNMAFQWVLDLTAGTVTTAANVVPAAVLGTAAMVNTTAVPSSARTNASGDFEYYMPIPDAVAATGSTVKKFTIPKTGVTPTIGTGTACTLTGMGAVTLPNPNSAPSTDLSSGLTSAIYLNQSAVNGKEYVVVLTHSHADCSANNGAYGIGNNPMTDNCTAARHSLTVFQIDPTNSSNLVYKSQLTDNAFGVGVPLFGMVKSSDSSYIVLHNRNQFVILYWNPTTESYSYSKTYTMANIIDRITLDSNNQLWIEENGTGNIFIYHLTDSSNVEISWENNITAVDYTGTDITKNVVLNVFSVTGTRQAKQLALSLTGPAVFTDTNSQSNTVTTSATADLVVGVTIKGYGSVQVIPTLVA